MREGETIYAPITGGGGSVCVYRLSGPHVLPMVTILTGKSSLKPRYVYKTAISDQAGNVIDPSALVVFFPAPNSYTGEDVAEINLHASKVVSDHFFDTLHQGGLRLAKAGEFSKRAVLRGKMTLDQALGVRYLIESKTQQQHRAALSQMTGTATQAIHHEWDDVRERLLLILSYAEASLEFPDEEDISDEIERSLTKKIDDVIPVLAAYRVLYEKRELLRLGIPVVLVGPPNVGKSSLLNALARQDCAIVSDIPGTTRDIVQILVNWGGYAVRLIDTAGLRETQDPIEQMGIDRTRQQEKQARITLLLMDHDTLDQQPILRKNCASPFVLEVLTKSDVASYPENTQNIVVSAQTGQGLQNLEAAVKLVLEAEYADCIEQTDQGVEMKAMLDRAWIDLQQAKQEKRLEIRVQILYDLVATLETMITAFDKEEVLDRVFSSFCIGK